MAFYNKIILLQKYDFITFYERSKKIWQEVV